MIKVITTAALFSLACSSAPDEFGDCAHEHTVQAAQQPEGGAASYEAAGCFALPELNAVASALRLPAGALVEGFMRAGFRPCSGDERPAIDMVVKAFSGSKSNAFAWAYWTHGSEVGRIEFNGAAGSPMQRIHTKSACLWEAARATAAHEALHLRGVEHQGELGDLMFPSTGLNTNCDVTGADMQAEIDAIGLPRWSTPVFPEE